jgi:hypothetical protein
MKFSEVKDANGTHLSSYAETLTEKAAEAGFTVTMIFASKEHCMLHTISGLGGDLPAALISLAQSMKSGKPATEPRKPN